jgi:hypothetical protein
MGRNGYKRDYYWVCAVEAVTGRPVVQGPHNTEAEATQWGFANIHDGNFKVYAFDTIDKTSARDKFKNIRLEETKQLETVFKRAKYP